MRGAYAPLERPYVSAQEYRTRHPGFVGGGDPTDEETAQLDATLLDASELIRDEFPGEIDPVAIPAVVRRLVVTVAHRVLSNPANVTRESIGDASYSMGTNARTGMRLYPKERAELRRCSTPGSGSGTRVVHVTPG